MLCSSSAAITSYVSAAPPSEENRAACDKQGASALAVSPAPPAGGSAEYWGIQ